MLEQIRGLHLPTLPPFYLVRSSGSAKCSPHHPSQETKTHGDIGTFGQSTNGTCLVVIWAKKANEVFERFSSSGNVHFTWERWGLPQSDLAQKSFQVTVAGPLL